MPQKSSSDLLNLCEIISQFLLKSLTHPISTKRDWLLRQEKQICPRDREVRIELINNTITVLAQDNPSDFDFVLRPLVYTGWC